MRLNRGVVVLFVVIGVAMLAGSAVMWLSDDGGLGQGPDIAALTLGGVGAFYLVLMMALWLFVRRHARLTNTGVPATATIISARDSGTVVNNQPRLILEVEITPEDGRSPYRFTTKKVISHSGLAAVRPGAVLPVSVDPRRPERFAFVDTQQFATIGGRGPSDTHDRLQRLERLAALHAAGALSDEEFAAEKQRLLHEQ